MASSRGDESQRPLPENLAEELYALGDERVEIAVDDEALRDPCVGLQETLDLGHARLRSECWGALAQRGSPRPRRRRSVLHAARPTEPAEARFVPPGIQFPE